MFKVGDRVWHKYLNKFCLIHKVVEESRCNKHDCKRIFKKVTGIL